MIVAIQGVNSVSQSSIFLIGVKLNSKSAKNILKSDSNKEKNLKYGELTTEALGRTKQETTATGRQKNVADFDKKADFEEVLWKDSCIYR